MAEFTQQDLEKLFQAVTKLAQTVAAKETEATEKVDETSALLELVLKREARLEEKEKSAQVAFAQRDKQRRANAREFDANLKAIQSRCKHKKGTGKKWGGMADGRNDYAIIHHVFVDHSEMRMCQICKMKWHPGDTHTSLVRDGRIFPNHTKLSWEEVAAFPTTNTMTASEAPIAPATMERDVATKLLDLMKDKDVSKVMAFLKSPEGQHFTNDQSIPTTEVVA